MKTSLLRSLTAFTLFTLSTPFYQPSTCAQGTAFNYQGWLSDGGAPANGAYDLTFTLFDAPSGGAIVGTSNVVHDLGITNGLFNVALDFGGASFDGGARWLEIAVRPGASADGYTNVSPRQPITATPYAIRALNFSGAISNAQLAGTYGSAVNISNAANVFGGSFSGNGGGLSNLNAANLVGPLPAAALSNAWRIGGNAGISAANNFIGTTDDKPLELRVNNSRALRLQPDPSPANAPNVIGGSPVNVIAPGVVGTTIAGGGSADYEGNGPAPNTVGLSYGTVGGGVGNDTAGVGATIGGGYNNTSIGFFALVGGGGVNIANGDYASVGGGLFNQATNTASTVAGGRNNRAIGRYSSVGGGTNAQALGQYSTVAGGQDNVGVASFATVGGGRSNHATNTSSTVAGGESNRAYGPFSMVGGGVANHATNTASTVAGGQNNRAYGIYSTVSGGTTGLASGEFSTIGGGSDNLASGIYTTVAGGRDNLASGIYSTVAGGHENTSDDFGSTVSGGYQNISSDTGSTVGGGSGNVSSGQHATVCGGSGNTAGGSWSITAGGSQNEANGHHSFAAGKRAKAEHNGAFVWADTAGNLSLEDPFLSTAPRQFLIRAEGGVGIGHNAPNAPLHVVGGSDASLGGGGTFVLGAVSGLNMAFDGNEIVARNNGAASPLFLNADGGNVGIGHNAPDAPLHVVGGSDAGLGGGGTFVLGPVSGLNMVLDGNEIVARNNGAASPLFLNAGGGNVGIGSTTADAPLHVVGGLGVSLASGGTLILGSGDAMNMAFDGNEIQARNNSAASRLSLNRAGGNVNIGNTIPDAPLHVVGGSDVSPSGGGTLVIGDVNGNNIAIDGNEILARNDRAVSPLFLNPIVGAHVSIGTTTTDYALRVLSAYCTGSTWVSASDRNLKAGFAPVDTLAILAKVAALPMQTWHYTNAPGTRHIGPMAQDFQAAFGVGDDDKTIATIDTDGVALAAIQGLNALLKAQAAELHSLKQEMMELRRAVSRQAEHSSAH